MSSVKSPCVSICALDHDDICIGCYRTGQEISQWGRLSDTEKQVVMAKVNQREQASFNVGGGIQIPVTVATAITEPVSHTDVTD